jgi:hypothetical protein
MKKRALSIAAVFLWIGTASAIAEVSVEDTKQDIIDKSDRCGKANVRELVAEGRYITVAIKTKITFENNQMLIDEIKHTQRFAQNDDVYYESNTLKVVRVDLSLLSITNKAVRRSNRVKLECSQVDGQSSSRCFKINKQNTIQQDGPLNMDTKTYNTTGTSARLYLSFCNADTAMEVTKSLNYLVVKSD